MRNRWGRTDNWVNINRSSDEYIELRRRYIEVFDCGIPMEVFPKTVTFEELRKEVVDSIKESVELTKKYGQGSKPLYDPDDYINIIFY